MPSSSFSMLDFFRSGGFGPLRPGVARELVHQQLGETDDIVEHDDDEHILCYDALFVHVHPTQATVHGLSFSFADYDLPRLRPGCAYDPWVVVGGLSPAALLAALGEQAIECESAVATSAEGNSLQTVHTAHVLAMFEPGFRCPPGEHGLAGLVSLPPLP